MFTLTEDFETEIAAALDGKTKPVGSLGQIEALAATLAAFGARLCARVLAEEVLFLRRSETGVAVGGAYHAELVRIRAELFLHLQSDRERRTSVLVLQHVDCFQHTEVEIALVPGLIIGKLIIR